MPRSPFEATAYVASVDLVDVGRLASEGVRCVLLDRDNTCVPRDAKVAPPQVLDWLGRVREAGMATCVVSNNFHSAEVERSARELGCEVVHHAMKPLPFAVHAALRKVGVPAEQAVLVGDQVFTDVVAGNLAGVRAVLVRPQSTQDLWYTQLLRVAERAVLRGRRFRGE
ncbi:HAD superfamily phosphatase [Olsenella sp. oral taxon 809 str. F0356]|uniref:YqeG family HAD IIIA-type phosphatase n=1 Tax=Olsenella sp. oral taxon 809 TaxID=661086 RepID=UPI000231ED92|nr:YqeG family HAD IIIA-type phosphatase [Olsenella sp. oral taxon 809]EHF01653.1 HAD superfamily phosphatase [Olsenella sp. oral taxon 809 str. F0356]